MAKIELSTLRPEFREERHGLYVDALVNVLNRTGPDRPFNIALTGAYGSGKSSVLHQLANVFDGRALIVELSSLGGDEPANGSDVNESKSPLVTKFIQKEIVKQLLFRRAPEHMRGSHYRRVEAYNPERAWGLAALITAVLFGIAVAAGGLDLLGARFPSVPSASHPFFVILILFAAFVCIAGALRLFHGRVRISQLSAGEAVVSLDDQNAYYFDEYLDELLFFFQKTEYDIVIFEDIDRFNNPHIFDTLRELNTILNNAEQVGRDIRFVYALKDSIFEQVEVSDYDARTLRNASTTRTKFFDLVVPLVPFISHKSARDLLTELMQVVSHPVGDDIIRLVSRYLTDMRLILNIRNEYEIFAQKVIVEGKVEGLSNDHLFAMVVYKNLHLGDFERIPTGESNLDAAYDLISDSVNAAIATLDSNIQANANDLNDADAREGDQIADRLGGRLDQILTNAIRPYTWSGNLSANGMGFDRESMRTITFWQELATSGSVIGTAANGHRFELSSGELRALLNEEIVPDLWGLDDAKDLRQSIDRMSNHRQRLLDNGLASHISDSTLVTRASDLENETSSRPLTEAVRELVGDGLPFELLSAGYIDQNFALYSAQYYGKTVSASARTFIIRSVQARESLQNYTFDTPASIDQVIREEGEELLAGPAAYNTQVFDHLLATAPSTLKLAIARIAEGDAIAQDFLAHYVRNGAAPELLFAELAPRWEDTFSYLAKLSDADAGSLDRMLNAALGTAEPTLSYQMSDAATSLIRDRYLNLEVLTTSTTSKGTAGRIAEVLASIDVSLPSIAKLSRTVMRAIAAIRGYDLTLENLSIASGADRFSLNGIRTASRTAYMHCMLNLAAYATAIEGTHTTTIESDPLTSEIIDDLMTVPDISTVAYVLQSADERVVVDTLEEVNYTRTWSALVATARVTPSWANIWTYFKLIPGDDTIDWSLGSFLGKETPRDVSGAEENKQRFAVAVVNSTEIDPDRKIAILDSLALENYLELEALDLSAEEEAFIADLVDADQLPDDQTVYDYIDDDNWSALERLIAVSGKFPDYLPEIVVPQLTLDRIVKSSHIGPRNKLAFLTHITSLSEPLPERALRALAKLANAQSVAFGLETLVAVTDQLRDADLAVEFIRPSLSSLDTTDLVELLEHLGEPYNSFKVPGSKVLFVRETPGNVALADRATELNIIRSSGHRKNRPGQISIYRLPI